MGIISDLFGGSDFNSAVAGDPASNAVPIAPVIPDVVQPSAPQVQQARQAALQRSTFLGRTRGGTLVRRARSVAETAAVEPGSS